MKDRDTSTKPPPDASSIPPTNAGSHHDVDAWLPYLDGVDGSVEQKRELIGALWQIMISYCDLYWEANASGQMPDLAQVISHLVIESDQSASGREKANVRNKREEIQEALG